MNSTSSLIEPRSHSLSHFSSPSCLGPPELWGLSSQPRAGLHSGSQYKLCPSAKPSLRWFFFMQPQHLLGLALFLWPHDPRGGWQKSVFTIPSSASGQSKERRGRQVVSRACDQDLLWEWMTMSLWVPLSILSFRHLSCA